MKRCWLSFLVALVFLTQAHALTNNSCSATDKKEIAKAIKNFLAANHTIDYKKVVILSQKCSQEYARATVHPKKPITDDATVYLNQVKGQWRVISMGTYFEPDFLTIIPKDLR